MHPEHQMVILVDVQLLSSLLQQQNGAEWCTQAWQSLVYTSVGSEHGGRGSGGEGDSVAFCTYAGVCRVNEGRQPKPRMQVGRTA